MGKSAATKRSKVGRLLAIIFGGIASPFRTKVS
jgi:hypothetical protein